MLHKFLLKLKFALSVVLLKLTTTFIHILIIPMLAICAWVIISSAFYGLIDPLMIWLEYGKWPSRDILYLTAPENCSHPYMRPDGLSIKDWCRPAAIEATGWIGVDRLISSLMDALNVFIAGVLSCLGVLLSYGVLSEKLEACEVKYKRISGSRLLAKKFFL